MNVLIIGSGGREHALAWKIKQSTKVSKIFVAPGNAGTATLAKNLPISKTKEIFEWIKVNKPDLVIVGPDNYLAEGIVDKVEKLGIPIFGPTKKASEIEWSKAFAKKFMKEEGIPTARFEVFKKINKAKEYLESQKFPLVIKASGLASGKGVIIPKSFGEGIKVLEEMMGQKIFGKAGEEVVIEECLEGREISIHAFCDGETAVLFPPSQDHKRIFDGDKGPNTGGMGTIAPVSLVTKNDMKEIKEKIVLPTLRALKRGKRIFKGILFPGIMLTKDGPKVIEFNARFGDPETQSYMRILESDLLDILIACVQGKLSSKKIKWSNKFASTVVCVSGGYPGVYKKGKKIKGLEKVINKDVVVFHAGTTTKNRKVMTNGGRVLCVTATSNTLKETLSKSYSVIKQISYEGMQYRKDIGKKSL